MSELPSIDSQKDAREVRYYEMAKEIESLRAEVERLREGIMRIAEVYTPNGNLAKDIHALLSTQEQEKGDE